MTFGCSAATDQTSPAAKEHVSTCRGIRCDAGALAGIAREIETGGATDPPGQHEAFDDWNHLKQVKARGMPLIELNRAGEQSYVHLSAMLPSAGCPDMHHGRRRREMDLPAGSCYAISKVSILKVQK